jgi:hypothetical protein
MPVLSEKNIVDLRKSKHANKDKYLSIGVVIELLNMTMPERANVMTYSLTEEQQVQIDEHFEFEDKHKSSNPQITELNLDMEILYLNGIIINLKKKHKIQGLLASIYLDKAEQNTIACKYLNFLDENKDRLNDYGIHNEKQLRSLRRDMNNIVHDFFMEPESLKVNPKYI